MLKPEELKTNLDDAVQEPTENYQKQILTLYKQRMDIIEYCEKGLKRATQEAEKLSVDEIAVFQKYKKRKIAAEEGKGEDRGDEDVFG